MKKFMCVCFLALLSMVGNVRAEEGKKSILATIFGEKPEHWVELGGGFGGETVRGATSYTYSNPAVYQPIVEKYLHAKTAAAMGGMVSGALNATSKLSLNVDYMFGNASTQIDIGGSNPSNTGELKVNYSPVVSVNYWAFSLYDWKLGLGFGGRQVSLSGPAGFLAASKIESGEMNLVYQVSLKSPVFLKYLLALLTYRHAVTPVDLDSDMSPMAHMKTTGIGSDTMFFELRGVLF